MPQSVHTKKVATQLQAKPIIQLGVSIGRFGSVFTNFCKTEPNRLELATEPNRTD